MINYNQRITNSRSIAEEFKALLWAYSGTNLRLVEANTRESGGNRMYEEEEGDCKGVGGETCGEPTSTTNAGAGAAGGGAACDFASQPNSDSDLSPNPNQNLDPHINPKPRIPHGGAEGPKSKKRSSIFDAFARGYRGPSANARGVDDDDDGRAMLARAVNLQTDGGWTGTDTVRSWSRDRVGI